ncbi:hypothetical protein BaRGS_00004900 [Batillaria attramentaria]|uniref:Uncharacterized protein n=1 Tax=Batillaria attramentaria TaxID=370345 RepID=A0ABD0LW88_9CAEN
MRQTQGTGRQLLAEIKRTVNTWAVEFSPRTGAISHQLIRETGLVDEATVNHFTTLPWRWSSYCIDPASKISFSVYRHSCAPCWDRGIEGRG